MRPGPARDGYSGLRGTTIHPRIRPREVGAMGATRAVLADDHDIVRAGLRLLLEGLPDIEVVGEADTGQEALQLIQTLRPQLALLDIEMPGPSGLEVTARALQELPDL